MGSRRNWWISLKDSSIKSAFDAPIPGGWLRHLRSERGSQTIEFIGVLPLFLLMIIIVWQFALAAAASITAKQAAMEGARAAMVEDVQGTGYETAVRNAVSSYKIKQVSKQEFGYGSDTYVKVSVTLDAPLIMNDKLFNTSGLELPITAEVTVRKEKRDQ